MYVYLMKNDEKLIKCNNKNNCKCELWLIAR